MMGSLKLVNGGRLQSNAFGMGRSGNIRVLSQESVVLNGQSPEVTSFSDDFSSGIFSRTGNKNSAEKPGMIYISARNIVVGNGAVLTTSSFGQGGAGVIDLNAQENILFTGEGKEIKGSRGIPSGAYSRILEGGSGESGTIKINTGKGLSLQSGAIASVSSDGQGNAGDIVLAVGSLELVSGGRLQANAFGKGRAGNIKVLARESVVLDGQNPKFESLDFPSDNFSSGIFSRVENKDFVEKSGIIHISAKNIFVSNGAILTTSSFGKGGAGIIDLSAKENILFSGEGREFGGSRGIASGAYSRILENGGGEGGNIKISAGNLLSLKSGAIVSVSSDGQGNAGNIQIDANDVFLTGISIDKISSTGLFSSIKNNGSGNEGNIKINTRESLKVEDGAIIVVNSLGVGNSGYIKIYAGESVLLDGANIVNGQSSGLFAGKAPSSLFRLPTTSEVGGIIIDTPLLKISNGAVISTRTQSSGAASDINININYLSILNGGQILTSTEGAGKAGDIFINAKEDIVIAGSDPSYSSRLETYQRAPVNNDEKIDQFFLRNIGAVSGLFANSSKTSSGDGGSINLISPSIQISNGARIFTDSEGKGQAGDITLKAQNIALNNNAFLSSETSISKGGDIVLQVKNLLSLRRNSQISTTAGKSGDSGDGGDIRIFSEAGFIVAPPYDNSDIKANAFNGKGGVVDINVKKVFGMFVRSRSDLIRLLGSNDPKDLDPIRLGTSDITAISQNNPTLNGFVAVSQLEVDPTRGLNAEPLRPQRPNVSEDCDSQNQSKGSRVTSSGRGGITPTPGDSLTGSMIWQDSNQPIASSSPPEERSLPIAQGWVQRSNGNILLIGTLSPTSHTPTCHVR